MFDFANPAIVSKVLLFLSIILISITSNTTLELQPKFKVDLLQSNQSSHNVEQKEVITDLKAVSRDIPQDSKNHKVSGASLIVPNKVALPDPETNLGTIMEGGGAVASADIPLNNLHETETERYHETEHTKGSKGRKGVNHLQSSVVPRKGVLDSDHLPSNDSPAVPSEEKNPAPTLQPTIKPDSEQLVAVSNSLNSTGNNVLEHQSKPVSTKPLHHKKPEFASDDDFDNQTLIKTSATGEDYVIIGIVIVIGIWFSVFGALIFYRRAGEYWDRRHYRRMDFLVEGMYND